MNSIFFKTKEELRTEKCAHINFDKLLSRNIRKCNLDESLELFLYDVSDALQNRETLLIEASTPREDAYIIPLLLAYKNSIQLNRFIIACNSEETIERIIKRIKEISELLNINIPIHTLDKEESYLCLRRLKKHAGKRDLDCIVEKNTIKDFCNNRYKRNEYSTLSSEDWKKIHVKKCSLSHCKFFKECKYALEYQSTYELGCIIISHQSLIKRKIWSEVGDIPSETDFIVIDEAESFATNIKNYYENSMHYEVIHKYFSYAERHLTKYRVCMRSPYHEQILQSFFKEIYENENLENILNSSSIKIKANALANISKSAYIQLTRNVISLPNSSSLEHLCEILFIIEKFFRDIELGEIEYSYTIKNRVKGKDSFKNIEIFYVPKKVDTIISKSLKKQDCSIIFTGIGIAGEKEQYSNLCRECGIESINDEVIKEFVLKK